MSEKTSEEIMRENGLTNEGANRVMTILRDHLFTARLAIIATGIEAPADMTFGVYFTKDDRRVFTLAQSIALQSKKL